MCSCSWLGDWDFFYSLFFCKRRRKAKGLRWMRWHRTLEFLSAVKQNASWRRPRYLFFPDGASLATKSTLTIHSNIRKLTLIIICIILSDKNGNDISKYLKWPYSVYGFDERRVVIVASVAKVDLCSFEYIFAKSAPHRKLRVNTVYENQAALRELLMAKHRPKMAKNSIFSKISMLFKIFLPFTLN